MRNCKNLTTNNRSINEIYRVREGNESRLDELDKRISELKYSKQYTNNSGRREIKCKNKK